MDERISITSTIKRAAERAAERFPNGAKTVIDLTTKGGIVENDSGFTAILAAQPNTAPSTLGELARADDSFVRVEVARNPSTAEWTLDLLAGDESHSVRAVVAQNPRTPGATLWSLLDDPVMSVRVHALRNPNVPLDALVEVLSHIQFSELGH